LGEAGVQCVEQASDVGDLLVKVRNGARRADRIVVARRTSAPTPTFGRGDELLEVVEFVEEKRREQARLCDVSGVGGPNVAAAGGVDDASRGRGAAVQRVVARVHRLQCAGLAPSGRGAR